jgi:hypothetical protein
VQIETELPPALSGAKPGPKGGFPITITLNSAHAFACQHPFYVLMAPSQEVQTAWCNALWQVGSNCCLCGSIIWQVGQLWLLPVQPHCLLPAADLSLLLCHAHACRQPSHELILCTTWGMPA